MLRKNKFLMMIFTLFLIVGCATDSMEVPRYRGYYFDAKINDANVIELDDRTKIATLGGYVRDVKWRLDKPIKGNFNVNVKANKNTEKYIGQIRGTDDLEIVMLTPVDIETTRGLKSDSTVQINGGAAVTTVNVMKNNVLPKGDYVFRVKVFGAHNWDRKEIYVQVR